MKKLTSLLLCIVMLMSLAVTAFAAVDEGATTLPSNAAITMATNSTNASANTGTPYRWGLLKDGVISTEGSKVPETYATNAIYPAKGESAWVTVDLGEEYSASLSGMRLYNRLGWANQAISKAYIYLSDDGENWIRSDLANVSNSTRYADIALKFNGTVYDAKARYIRLEAVQVGGSDSNPHWGMEELELLNVSGEAKTVDEIKTAIIESEAESAKALINAINTRVTGSIENVNTINAARAAYDGLSAEAKSFVDEETLSVLTNAENALSGVVKEIDTTPGSQSKISVTGKSDHENVTLGNPGRLTDGLFSQNGEVGNTYYSGADFAVYPDANEYLHLTVTMTEAQNVSGIRFYTRKAWGSANLNKNNNAKSAKVTLYSGDAYVTSDIITLTQSSDSIYCDAALKFNSEQITVTNVTKIEIIVLENIDQAHWGAEELRLLGTNGTEKGVSDIAKTLVTLSTPTFESGVYEKNGTGIIRFFTTFDAIADGAEIESFGTYAHVNSVSENMNDKCAKYEGKTPAVNDNFSVDVTGITAGYFNEPVFALSFVKIKGYDNLILSGISTGATVNTKNKLK